MPNQRDARLALAHGLPFGMNERIREILTSFGLTPEAIDTWRRTVLPALGTTPDELVAKGEEERLIAHLLVYAQGNVG